MPRHSHAARRRLSHLSSVSLATCLGCASFTAHAAEPDIRWTGGAGAGLPFWDLAHNWNQPFPPGSSFMPGFDWVDLGDSDTTLRYGYFPVGRLTGTGTLTVTGGGIGMESGGGRIDALRMEGGGFARPWITVGTFHWSGGGFTGYSPSSGNGYLIVEGDARITGAGWRSGPSFTLLANTVWDAADEITSLGLLHVVAGARLEDRAGPAGHRWVQGSKGDYLIDGNYVKTGAGESTLQIMRDTDFRNTGSFDVREGSVHMQVGVPDEPGYLGGPEPSRWTNAGTLQLSGGSLHVELLDSAAVHTGHAIVDAGTLRFALEDASLHSTGDWSIARNAVLRFQGRTMQPGMSIVEIAEGLMTNHGLLSVENTRLRFAPAATLLGAGDVAVSANGVFEYAQPLQLRSLRIGSGEGAAGHVQLSGSLAVHDLVWGHGTLSSGGPITVHGWAQLSGYSVDAAGRQGKRLDSELTLLHGGTWNGADDLYGAGALHLASGAAFQIGGNNRTRTLALERIHNEGHITVYSGVAIDARVDNEGLIDSQFGTLAFRGPLSNRGTLSGEWSRVEIHTQGLPWRNEGRVQLIDADMRVIGGMANAGQTVLGIRTEEGRVSRLDVDGSYTQHGEGAETWIDGILQANTVSFESGVFGAGLRGNIGFAELTVGTVGFGDATLHLDIGSDRLDQIAVDGLVTLNGRLDVNFEVPNRLPDPTGTYRFLTAADGILGSFDTITSSLDPSLYRLTALYGDGYVALQVAAVPEPETYALMALGLAVVWGVRRRRSVPVRAC